MRFARWAVTLLILPLLFLPLAAKGSDFPPITPDELKMTSLPEQPGAAAVILNREEVDDDMLSVQTIHERIKILTDAGREYANVEIPYSRRAFIVAGVSGHTTHADGSVVPFQGKPFDKTVIKGRGVKINVKTFTLPDVQVGSIIEYKYDLRYDDRRLFPPTWEVEKDLFTRKAYFKYIPFQNHGGTEILLPHGQIAYGVSWTPFLGNGAQPQMHSNPAGSSYQAVGQISTWVDLNINNVPALLEEPEMPPASMLRWRVYFYYQESRDGQQFWKDQGKFWNKEVEGFVGKNKGVDQEVSAIVTPTDSPEQKVRKIYAFVSKLENQDYIPKRTAQEDLVLDLKQSKGAEDVLEHKSGKHDELNRLFVSMVRAAGIPASLIWVPDRSREIFLKPYLSTDQFDAEIAIVQLDGKDVFLDPGSKFCPYGIVDWKYTDVGGLRQSPKGADFGQVSPPTYKQAVLTRMANLTLDPNGVAHGQISLVFKGLEAMARRQEAGKTDEAGRKKLLEDELRTMVPGNSEVTLTNQPDWENQENMLVAEFKVSFPFAVVSGKRLLIQQHLFQIGAKNRFAPATRSNAVYFHYPWQEADEVHVTLPAGMQVESVAPDDTVKLEYAVYQVRQKEEQPGKLFSRRDFIMGGTLIEAAKYAEIKGFFDKLKTDDDQPALVKIGASLASSN